MTDPEKILQERMIALIRAFGLHRPDHTPCGRAVPVSEAHALLELARTPTLSPTDLAARLRLDRSTVTRLVQHLAERGWLTRERDARDGRAVRLHLTRPGHEAAAQLAEARAEKLSGIVAALPVAERETVLHALGLLVRALDDRAASDTGARSPRAGADIPAPTSRAGAWGDGDRIPHVPVAEKE